MENDKFLKLTNAVYKILEFFPESDPLKHRAKDKALAIMDGLILINEKFPHASWATLADTFKEEKIKTHILEDIDILLGYLWIGKSQGWLNSVNCLIVANEYDKVKKEISDKSPEGHFDGPAIIPPEVDLDGEQLSDRQSKIIDFLSKNEKAQVMDLQTILPNITKRTIRRDLDELLKAGKIVRTGDFNQVSYQLRG